MRIEYRHLCTLIWVAGFIALTAGLVIAADEISITANMQLKNGDLNMTRNIPNLKVTQIGNTLASGVQNIQTGAWELIVVPTDVSSNGYSFFRGVFTNADSYIDFGSISVSPSNDTSYVGFLRVKKSDIAIAKLHPTNDIYAQGYTTQADVTGLNLEWWINQE